MDKQRREEIINYYDKSDFRQFLENDSNGIILELLNDEGINILRHSSRREDRICYILSFSPYKNQLFNNSNFVDMFLKTDIDKYYAVLGNLDFRSYDMIFDMAINIGMESHYLARLFNYFSEEYKLSILDKWPYSERLLYDVLSGGSSSVFKKIIENYNIDFTKYNLNIKRIFEFLKDLSSKNWRKRNNGETSIIDIEIPSRMIDQRLFDAMWKKYDIYEMRMLINDADYFMDSSFLNQCMRKREDKIINDCSSSSLIYPFNELYEIFCRMMEAYENDDDNYYNIRRDYINILNIIDDDTIHDELRKKYTAGGISEVKLYLKKFSDMSLSNYIIDYSFLENYHNVILDINELLNFYNSGNIDIPRERVELYSRIAGIDSLPTVEKKELHNVLKQYNIMEVFYDDMSFARNIVNRTIKDSSLTKDKLKKYYDNELSEKYGVDVYKMDDRPFFGIVKSGGNNVADLPMGYSYSLVGNGGLATFDDPKNLKTFLYDADDLNPNQIVHLFPYDSFTSYKPFENYDLATDRVNTLAMPKELVGISNSYVEMLLLMEGKKETQFDKDIPRLKRMALYCIDEIDDKAISIANENGVGIILVSSDGCKLENNVLSDKHRHISMFEYNYFVKHNDKKKFDSKR